MKREKLVIIGGGFAGSRIAKELEKNGLKGRGIADESIRGQSFTKLKYLKIKYPIMIIKRIINNEIIIDLYLLNNEIVEIRYSLLHAWQGPLQSIPNSPWFCIPSEQVAQALQGPPQSTSNSQEPV